MTKLALPGAAAAHNRSLVWRQRSSTIKQSSLRRVGRRPSLPLTLIAQFVVDRGALLGALMGTVDGLSKATGDELHVAILVAAGRSGPSNHAEDEESTLRAFGLGAVTGCTVVTEGD